MKHYFSHFSKQYNKSYASEEEKTYRFKVYSANQVGIVEVNMKQMGVSNFSNRFLAVSNSSNSSTVNSNQTNETIHDIIIGHAWTDKKKAYKVGYDGQSFCFLLFVNKFADKTVEEFFSKRKNNAKVNHEYIVELKGDIQSEYDWTPYLTPAKDQGATTTCYIEAINSMYEAKLTKFLRELPKEIRDLNNIDENYTCNLDADASIVCIVIEQNKMKNRINNSTYDKVQNIQHKLNTRRFSRAVGVNNGYTFAMRCQPKPTPNALGIDISADDFEAKIERMRTDSAYGERMNNEVCKPNYVYVLINSHPILSDGIGTMLDDADWIYVPAKNSKQLQLHLTYSPVSIVMYICEPDIFKSFGDGVYKNSTKCSETQITHAALVIGYGETEKGEAYWELLNSYSEDWGDKGKIKLARNVPWNQYGGQNGILIKPQWLIGSITYRHKTYSEVAKGYYYGEVDWEIDIYCKAYFEWFIYNAGPASCPGPCWDLIQPCKAVLGY